MVTNGIAAWRCVGVVTYRGGLLEAPATHRDRGALFEDVHGALDAVEQPSEGAGLHGVELPTGQQTRQAAHGREDVLMKTYVSRLWNWCA